MCVCGGGVLAGGSGLLLLAAAPGGDISHLDGPLRFLCCSCAPAVVQLKAPQVKALDAHLRSQLSCPTQQPCGVLVFGSRG